MNNAGDVTFSDCATEDDTEFNRTLLKEDEVLNIVTEEFFQRMRPDLSMLGTSSETYKIRAKENMIPVIPRAEMLAELMRMKYGIAIAGTHGKTTTTSLVSTVLAGGKLDPTVVIGGQLKNIGSHAKLGQSEFLVAEADESDGSFLRLSPTIAVVTTLDEEHMEFYQTLEKIKDTFLKFINKVPFYGSTILCLDDLNIQSLIPNIKKRYITYGLTSQADYTARNISVKGLKTSFNVYHQGKKLGRIFSRSLGRHNVLNTLAAVAVGMELDLSFKTVADSLAQFEGVQRRFEIVKCNIPSFF